MPPPATSNTAETLTSPYLQEKGQTNTDNGYPQYRPAEAHSPTKQVDTHEESALQSGSDQQDASISSAQRVSGKKPFSFWMSLLSLALTAIVTSWDATALAVALPVCPKVGSTVLSSILTGIKHITEQLQGTTLESFWANISFMLGVAVTQPIYVSFSDVLGRKIPFYASTAIFIIGTIVFSTAQDMSVLVAGRLVQGIGCGGLDVLEEIILADITTLKERPMYLGIIAMSIAAGSISGPIIGALLSEYDWRWIGWVNLPVIGPALVLAIFFLHLRPLDGGLTTRLRRVDWTGMALFASGATLFALPLSWADALYAWASWRTIVPFVIGIILLVIFGFYEKKPPEAILPYRLFKNRTAVSSFVTGLIHGLILYTALQYLPLFFQAVFLEAPLQAGVSTLPVAISVVAFSILAPVTVEITRRYQLLLWVGWICTTVAMGTWYLVGENTSRVTAYTIQVFLGIGIGIVYTVTQFAVQASVEDVNDTGLVSTPGALLLREYSRFLFHISLQFTPRHCTMEISNN